MALERKALPSLTSKDGTTSSPMTGVIGHDDAEGTVTAIVAVTGVRDRVGDLIEAGAPGRSLKRVKPKGVNNHQWGEKVSKVVWIEELMPGDGRLPELTSSGDPWPRAAGGLMVKAKYNLDKQAGRDAYADAKFYGPDENFSIGYSVLPGGARKTRAGRNIHELDIYEWSQVLHGAHQFASLVGVKSLTDAVTPPDQWYAGERSGTDHPSDEGGDLSPDHGVEFKAHFRTVKDPEYWGKPYGTPIRPGQKPRGRTARAIRRSGAVPDARRGTTVTGESEERTTPAAVRKASERDEPALLPEQDARRVKPGKPRKEASADPAAELVALMQDTAYDVIDQKAVDNLLGEVLDDALTPDEFEDELRDAVEGADVRDEDLGNVLDDYRARYRARLAEQEGGKPAAAAPAALPEPADLARAAKAAYSGTNVQEAMSAVVGAIQDPTDRKRMDLARQTARGLLIDYSSRTTARMAGEGLARQQADSKTPKAEIDRRLDLMGRLADTLDELGMGDKTTVRDRSMGLSTAIREYVAGARGDSAPSADAEDSDPRAGLRRDLARGGDARNSAVAALNKLAAHTQDNLLTTAAQVVSSTLTHKTSKTASQLADELVRVRKQTPDAPSIGEIRTIAGHIDQIADTLDEVGNGITINRGGQRVTLADHLRAYTDALRAALDADEESAPKVPGKAPTAFTPPTEADARAARERIARGRAQAGDQATLDAWDKLQREAGQPVTVQQATPRKDDYALPRTAPEAPSADSERQQRADRARDKAQGAWAIDRLLHSANSDVINAEVAGKHGEVAQAQAGLVRALRFANPDQTRATGTMTTPFKVLSTLAPERLGKRRVSTRQSRVEQAIEQSGVLDRKVRPGSGGERLAAGVIDDLTAHAQTIREKLDAPTAQGGKIFRDAQMGDVADDLDKVAQALSERSGVPILPRGEKTSGPAPGPTPEPPPAPQSTGNEVRQARRDAEDAIGDQDRDALADALTRMGVGTGDDDRDPREVAEGMLTIPTEVVTQRLDRLEQAATMVVDDQAAPKPEKPAEIADRSTDDLIAESHRLREGKRDSERQAELNREINRRHREAADERRFQESARRVEETAPEVPRNVGTDQAAPERGPTFGKPQDAVHWATDDPELQKAAALILSGQPVSTNKRAKHAYRQSAYSRTDADRDLQRDPEADKRVTVLTAGRIDLGGKSDFDHERAQNAARRYEQGDLTLPVNVVGHRVEFEEWAGEPGQSTADVQGMRKVTGTVVSVNRGSGSNGYLTVTAERDDGQPGTGNIINYVPADVALTVLDGSASPERDAVITPDDQADAEALRGDTLGLVEAEDGELEVTEEVAQRQDRVEALIESGGADLANRDTDELGGTRRDLVGELALQDELRRRDAQRRQDSRVARQERTATETTGGAEDTAPSPATDEGPKVRPGLTGALEDLADLLNEHGVKASDNEQVQAAAKRLATVLRRNKGEGEALGELRALLGDDVLARIEAGKLKPGRLLTLSGALRQEARDRRNAAARARRVARRIEREKLRSLLGTVDGLLRQRGRNPEEFGGPVAAAPTPERERQAQAVAPEREPVAPESRAPEPSEDVAGGWTRAREAVAADRGPRRNRDALAGGLNAMGVADADAEADRINALPRRQAEREIDGHLSTAREETATDRNGPVSVQVTGTAPGDTGTPAELAEAGARAYDEMGRPSLKDGYLDARANAEQTALEGSRIKLIAALKEMGVADPSELRVLRDRLTAAGDADDAEEAVEVILKEIDEQRDGETDWRLSDEQREAVRDRFEAAHAAEQAKPAVEPKATRAVKRPGRNGATEYEITNPDGTSKKFQVARDYTHARTVDRGEDAPGGRYLTTPHPSEEEADEPHPVYRKAPHTTTRIEAEEAAEPESGGQRAQSAPTEGERDGQRTGAPDTGALPDVPAGEGRGDDDGGLPGAGGAGAGGDRGDRGRPDRADRPELARRPADRAAPDGEAERGGGRSARGADRPERDSEQPGQRRPGTGQPDRGAAERGGRDTESRAGGVRERESGAGEDAAPEAAGEPDGGVTGQDQPDANPGQLDAIPDTGPSYRPGGIDDLAPAGERAKLDANMGALRTLRGLQRENRAATPDEQATLARWAGWGGVSDVFDETKSKYAAERTELKELLSPAEYNEARRNTLNAHYTDARAVQAIWQAVEDLGFDGGRVLEPGSGSGNFIGFAPDSAHMVGVELDSTTAAISKALYPHAKIRNESFAKTRLPDGSFDLTIGNVPFLNRALTDKRHNRNGENLHNHFIIKSLALTKPGGLVAVLTSRYTMDAQGSRARRTMADMGDLVGAVRLPTGSQQRAAGVNVVADVLIFRRREPGAEPRGDQSWINAEKRDLGGWEIPVNDYWAAHPDHVLGEMSGVRGQHGGEIKVVGDKDMGDLPKVLSKITHVALASGLGASGRDPDAPGAEFAAPNAAHEGAIATGEGGEFVQNVGGVMVPFDVPASQAEELRGLLGLRDTLTELLDAEAATDRDTPEIQALRQELNDRYDAHVARFKPVNYYELNKAGNRKPNPQGGFKRDPRSAIVRALEHYNPDDGTASKAAIFRKRAVAPRQLQASADNPADALALCIDQVGRVDLPTIARLLNTDEDDARAQLGDLVYEQPPLTDAEVNAAFEADAMATIGQISGMDAGADVDLSSIGESVRQPGALVPTAEYLSGNVRRKLAAARAAAEHDPKYKANADALQEVIPADLTPQEIEGRLGAAWIGADDVRDFVADLLELDKTYGGRASAKVSTSGGGIWTVDAPGWGNLATEQWGTSDRDAGELIQAMLEQRSIKVTRTVDLGDGKKKSVPDLEATLAAQAKAEAIADRFSEWLWEDPDRSRRLQARYNNQFNAIKLRSYDGTQRELPGKAKSITLWDHQHAAVSRIVNEPAALLAHVVGSGKTMEMAAGAMELKRLGLAKKPTIVIPNHMKEQFETEFLQLYPQAKILAAGSEDLEGPKRREFVARAATGDWDCVILTQKAFEAIPMSPAQQQAYIDREMADMRRQLEEAQDAALASGDDAAATTVKRMERAVLAAEQALEKKLDKGLKDVGGVTFEQTGIDYVFVDEAHHYSNLRTLSNIQGAGATGSGMATDLHMKIEYLRETNASNRVVTFATGTPIRNTVTQAYIMMRYLRPDLLKEAGINSFDQWAATFGKIIEEMELKPEGTGFRQTSRFAKFQNVPELLQILHVFTDVKMAEDLDLPTPELSGGKVQNVVVPRTAQVAEFIRDLGRRAELVRAGRPEERRGADGGMVEDNMLLVSMDGRKAALDMRLVGGDPEAGKIDVAADRISSIWSDHKDRRYPLDPKNPDLGDDPTPGALQIVFLDMGTPGDGKKKTGWNAYDDLKEKLVARGMAPESIRYMHEAKNDREKAEMFAAARSGRISVLIGSTEKMGVGTNVQARAVALHHLDAPWRPSDVEQRDGRIMRQGNAHQGLGIPVEIIRYVTEGSFDAYMWQTLERKSKFINQILRGSLTVREIEDVGENSLSYAEVKALATGNPDLMDKAKIDTLLGKLVRLSRTHERTQANLRRDAQRYAAQIHQDEADADALDAAIARRADTSGDKFVATVGTERHAKRTEANAALNQSLWDVLNGWKQDSVKVATLGGFDVYAQSKRARSGGFEVVVTLDGVPDPVVTYGAKDLRDGRVDTIARIESRLRNLEFPRNRRRDTAERLRAELPRMQERIGLEFARREELKAAQAKSDRLRAKMLLDIRRLEQGTEALPFDPQIDSARFDSPLVGGGTDADAPPDPDGLIEQAEWERMWELRRAQADAERATAPSAVSQVLETVQAALEKPDELAGGGEARLRAVAGSPRDLVHASPGGKVAAALDDDGAWVVVDAVTGFSLAVPQLAAGYMGDIDALLADLEQLKIPWGDRLLMKAKMTDRRGTFRTDISRQVRDAWQRHAEPEEKSLRPEAVITPMDALRARRLRADLEQAVGGLRGFA